MVQKDRGFQIFANAVMIILVICVLAPFFLMLMSSLTDERTLIANGYSFFPEKFSIYAYRYLIVQSGSVAHGYLISVLITVICILSFLHDALLRRSGSCIPDVDADLPYPQYVFRIDRSGTSDESVQRHYDAYVLHDQHSG